MSSASLVIGMHGAGIAHSLHMPIGTKYCCGVIEIFPDGDTAVEVDSGSKQYAYKGYENLARRLGHIYSRLDVSANRTTSKGQSTSQSVIQLVSGCK